jgi:hypothetical protein
MRVRNVLLSLGCLLLAGCCSAMHPATPPSTTPVAAILDRLKDELRLFAMAPAPQTPAGMCEGSKGNVSVVITPATATLKLKVVDSFKVTPNAGVKIPVGIVTVNPTIDASYGRTNTQELDLSLSFDQRTIYRARAADLQKQIDDDTKASGDTTLPADVQALLKKNIDDKKKLLLPPALRALAVADHAAMPAQSNSPASPNPPPALDPAKHPIAAALVAMREQLLRVDHNKVPCFLPAQLQAEIDFEVVKSLDAGVDVSFLIVDLGAKTTLSDDRTQSMIVTFNLSDSSSLLLEVQ